MAAEMQRHRHEITKQNSGKTSEKAPADRASLCCWRCHQRVRSYTDIYIYICSCNAFIDLLNCPSVLLSASRRWSMFRQDIYDELSLWLLPISFILLFFPFTLDFLHLLREAAQNIEQKLYERDLRLVRCDLLHGTVRAMLRAREDRIEFASEKREPVEGCWKKTLESGVLFWVQERFELKCCRRCARGCEC